ncbi:hypothetical protein [Bradyrhizobium australafricanum]|uniref:hypothetical protein n=1 Tax=Bradyrhizobium australafricanum TaxID=2821406 RepID=UPI001CE2BAC6|nr:hypothetical protein [Bradyrhizobium australafricanum]MCA6104738.1 hypothetical protein [Bradyrhizobium australafricanum]
MSAIEKLKSAFQRHGTELEYLPDQSRFSWCDLYAAPLPEDCGVYCLFSHDGSRIQKIGKAESRGGLRVRFRGYTGKKTDLKIANDKTDQRWKRIMTDALIGERLTLYYFVTAPVTVKSPIRFDNELEHELNCHWARPFEAHLSKLVRKECRERNLLDTHLLLSGAAD